MIRAGALIAALLLFAVPASGQTEERAAYIEANLLAIFYHEFGHALIDVMDLPVLGQEEDAADTASALMIDGLYDEDAAQDIAALAAFGFLDEAAQAGEPAWWDEHGPDLQRYYNLVCLFYGADPETRADLAEELELPEDRAEKCPEEFDLAASSWGPVLDEIATDTPSDTLRYAGGRDTPTEVLIADEVDALNQSMRLPETVTVRVEACDEANAFYDPNDQSITVCTELASHLSELFDKN